MDPRKTAFKEVNAGAGSQVEPQASSQNALFGSNPRCFVLPVASQNTFHDFKVYQTWRSQFKMKKVLHWSGKIRRQGRKNPQMSLCGKKSEGIQQRTAMRTAIVEERLSTRGGTCRVSGLFTKNWCLYEHGDINIRRLCVRSLFGCRDVFILRTSEQRRWMNALYSLNGLLESVSALVTSFLGTQWAFILV